MAYSNNIGPANSIELRVNMLTNIMDEVIAHDVKTSAMTPNSAMVQATSEANKFKIATAKTQGLGTYSKTFGYPMGKAELSWEEYTLRYDRSRGFMLDNIDIRQSGGLASATYMMSEFMRQDVIPEIDCLRIAGVAQRAIELNADNGVVYGQALTKANVLSSIRTGLNSIFQHFHTRTGNIIYMDYALKPALEASSEFQYVRQVSGAGSSVDMWIDAIDGNSIVWMPSDYMKTAFDLKDGNTTGQEDGGVTAASTAKSINFLITAPGVANGIVSVQSEKFIPKENNILADADFIALRLYHDVIVMKEKGPGLYLSVKESERGDEPVEAGVAKYSAPSTAKATTRTTTKTI